MPYVFDSIGNRQTTAVDGSTVHTYSSNELNQYEQIDSGQRVHDNDGNLADDGTLLYTWDAENRLIAVNRKSDSALIATYAYDPMGRRTSKRTTSAAPHGATHRLYCYDGWNLIAEYRVVDDEPLLHRTYTWGPDISGTPQGAGGVGGLLVIRDFSGQSPVSYYPLYDGNGNVTQLVKDNGSGTDELVAHYEYDPFGNLTKNEDEDSSGFNDANPFRFSTKYFDEETGFYYYAYRYYDPVTGRWPSRDPIGEVAFRNQLERSGHPLTQNDDWGVDHGELHRFVDNDGVNSIDAYGLLACCSGGGECRIEKTHITAPGVRIHVSTLTLAFAAVNPVSGCTACLDYIEGFNEGNCKAQAKAMELAENVLASLGGAPGIVVVYYGTYTRSISSDRCIGAP